MTSLASPSLADGVAGSPEPSGVDDDLATTTPAATSAAPQTSAFRGVALRKTTGLWRAAIKVNRVSYDLGAYRKETDAARAYDMAAVCAYGLVADKLNFPVAEYEAHAERLQGITLDELARQLRQQAGAVGGGRAAAARPVSRFQGIRWNKAGGGGGRWEAVIKVGGKSVYLGVYDTEEAAAQAYDQGALLRWAQGVGVGNSMGGSGLPGLNFTAELYSGLVGEEAVAGEDRKDDAGQGDEPPPPPPELLGKRYVEAVLAACRHYNSASTAVKSALGAGVENGVGDDGG